MMSELSMYKPDGKISFGADYLCIMRIIELEEDQSRSVKWVAIIDAVIKFFLLQRGFSMKEVNLVDQLFWDKYGSMTSVKQIEPVINRMIAFSQGNREFQERLLIEMICIVVMDNIASDREKYYTKSICKKFGFNDTQYNELIKIGSDWSSVLEYIGKKYVELNNN